MTVPDATLVSDFTAGPADPPPPSPADQGSPFAGGGGVENPVENPYESPQQVGQGYGATPPPGSVPNYLVHAILVTLFCCIPFGIVAIVYAAQVNGKLAAGDYAGAVAASNSAKTWSWASFLCGAIPIVLYMLAICAGAALG